MSFDPNKRKTPQQIIKDGAFTFDYSTPKLTSSSPNLALDLTDVFLSEKDQLILALENKLKEKNSKISKLEAENARLVKIIQNANLNLSK